MPLSIGIVGLPNVGKSTLFNALTKSKQADAQNYPFCTIEPNVGIVEVPDDRLRQLYEVVHAEKKVPTTIEFVDIAGLVKGASEGEGMGNAFLSHIREVDAIAQVVRAFADGNVTHVHGGVNPSDDAGVINLELILADWQSVSKRLENTKKKAKGPNEAALVPEITLLTNLCAHLESGKSARTFVFTEEERDMVHDLHLITMKPMMYVVNIDDGADHVVIEEGIPHVYVCAKTESELAQLEEDEAKAFMEELGVSMCGLDHIIKAGYELLGLQTFFTAGKQEARAWTVSAGTTAPCAAGVIHTDFIKGFIKADIVSWNKLVECKGWSGAKDVGAVQLVGRDYIIKDGDVALFHVQT